MVGVETGYEALGGAYSEAGVNLGLMLLVVINHRHDDRERDLVICGHLFHIMVNCVPVSDERPQ